MFGRSLLLTELAPVPTNAAASMQAILRWPACRARQLPCKEASL